MIVKLYMNLSVLHSCPYPVKYPPHGGLHRSEQIVEIIRDQGIKLQELQQSPWAKSRPIQDRLIGTVHSLRNWDLDAFRLRRIGGIGQLFNLYRDEIQHNGLYKAIIWETVADQITIEISHKYQIPVVALPQNIESFFVANYFKKGKKSVFEYLEQDIASFKKADLVFAISHEEQIFLRNFGVEADYLPYYPARRLVRYYSQIRQQRKKVSHDSFLILGSAINHVTLEGMLELLKWINLSSISKSLKVKLVGNKTEELAGQVDYPWLQICGTVTPDELEQHLINTQAMLVHQRRGLGALTKIPEMLVAGVPVIANTIAARSTSQYQGIYTYSSPEQLHACLKQSMPEPPIPQPPREAEAHFIEALLSKISQ